MRFRLSPLSPFIPGKGFDLDLYDRKRTTFPTPNTNLILILVEAYFSLTWPFYDQGKPSSMSFFNKSKDNLLSRMSLSPRVLIF